MNFPEQLGSPWFLLGFVLLGRQFSEDHFLYFCPFSFRHCIICPSIYGFWLPLWNLRTVLVTWQW